MGLLDSVVGAAVKALIKGDDKALGNISGLLGSLFEQVGGLPGLIKKFQASGLDDIIGSWMSTGENKPINTEQLHQVVGTDIIQGLAEKSGLGGDMFDMLLAKGLPKLVASITDDGEKTPEDVADISLDTAKDLIGKLFS